LKALFIDTGAFLAKEIAADQHHGKAVEFWSRIHGEGPVIYSSEHVLDETATLLARRTSYAWSAGWGRDVLGAGIHFLPAGEGDFEEAFVLMKKFADHAVSFTDCISFVLMKREGLRDVFGFDRHFASAGYRVWPNSQ
jgi:predicted nucleic acid-binding protein